jgi:3-dehydroquinate synthetase
MDELYEEFEKLTINHEPLVAAGIMMAQAMKIYKAMLSEDEFKLMTEHILESRNDILSVDKPTLQ